MALAAARTVKAWPRISYGDCVFMQRNMEKHGKLDQEHAFRIVEKTWGKDRLNKDCYKKGAKYEGL